MSNAVIYVVVDKTVKSYTNCMADDKYLVNTFKQGDEVTKLDEVYIDGIWWLEHEQGYSIKSAFKKKDEEQPDNPVYDDEDVTKYEGNTVLRVIAEQLAVYSTVPEHPTDYTNVIGSLTYGQEVKLLATVTVGKTAWTKHDCGGWSQGRFFELKEENDARYESSLTISNDNTELYDKPNGTVKSTLNKGDSVIWYKQKNVDGVLWTKVSLNPELWCKAEDAPMTREDESNIDKSNAGRDWTVTASVLNVRSGPGDEYDVVRTLVTGDRVIEIGKSPDENGNLWIKHDNGGWSFASYLKLTSKTNEETGGNSGGSSGGGTTDPEKVILVVTASALNVRSGPGTSYSTVRTLSYNDEVIMEEKKTVDGQTWVKHDCGGWSFGQYLKRKDGKTDADLASSKDDKTYKVFGRTEVREGPGTKYAVVGYLEEGEKVIEISKEVVGGSTWICHGPERWSRTTFMDPPKKNTTGDAGYSSVDDSYYWKTLTVAHDQAGIYPTPDNATQFPEKTLKKGDQVIAYLNNGKYVQEFNGQKWVNHDCGGWTVASAFVADGNGNPKAKESFLRIWTVDSDELMVREGPSTGSKAVGSLKKGDRVVVKEMYWDSDGTLWILHDNGGWSCTKGANGKDLIKETEKKKDDATSETDVNSQGYKPDPDDLFWEMDPNSGARDFAEFDNINHVAGIFGLPYQFLAIADPRIKGDEDGGNNSRLSDIGIGYEYAEKIIEKIPLLFIAPGKANFMSKYSNKDKRSVLEKIIRFGTGQDSGNSVEDLLDSDGRYYTFQYNMTDYYKYVNPMCRIAAKYMGVEDEELDGQYLGSINWEDFTKSRITSIGSFGTYTSIPFYVDTDTSISESFSNSTTQSMIASSVNSVSDMGRELGFLLGTVQTETGIKAIESDADVSKNIENIQNTISKIMGGGNFLGNLTKHLSTVAAGGKLVFPEIWSDSSFSRSYSCSFKFVAPDPSNLSIYLNVLVPLFHLMGLVVPQSVKTNPNGYVNPFIVRAMYKGFFNVDMGIITSMSVTKGAECQWSPEGVPTSIVVNIDIKDLYNSLSITPTDATDWKYDTLNNTSLMDYIANLCGINVYKPEVSRMIEMWFMNNFTNRAKDLFKVNIWGGIQERVQNAIVGIFR